MDDVTNPASATPAPGPTGKPSVSSFSQPAAAPNPEPAVAAGAAAHAADTGADAQPVTPLVPAPVEDAGAVPPTLNSVAQPAAAPDVAAPSDPAPAMPEPPAQMPPRDQAAVQEPPPSNPA